MTSRAISYKIAVGGDGATRQAEITFDDLKKTPLTLTALAPFAATSMPELDSFIPSLGSLIFINDLVTAVLLFAQYSINPSRALLVLASSYLFSALIVVQYILIFPGAFAPTGLLGAVCALARAGHGGARCDRPARSARYRNEHCAARRIRGRSRTSSAGVPCRLG